MNESLEERYKKYMDKVNSKSYLEKIEMSIELRKAGVISDREFLTDVYDDTMTEIRVQIEIDKLMEGL